MFNNRTRISTNLLVLVLLLSGCAPQQEEAPTRTALPDLPTPVVEQTGAVLPSPTSEPAIEEPVETAAIRFSIVPERSEARYLVTEQLVNVSLPNDAIGRTQQINGSLVLQPDGTILAEESRLEVDLSTLQSDESRRDRFIKENTLNTSQFPMAVFVPTEMSGLPAELPQSGDVSFKLIGDLTIRDVTRQVEWDVAGSVQGDEVTGQARTSFTFADFNLTQPRVPVVLSVEDTIRLEVDFTLQRSNG
jgi:polyisoprenoid-binding protein YceI